MLNIKQSMILEDMVVMTPKIRFDGSVRMCTSFIMSGDIIMTHSVSLGVSE